MKSRIADRRNPRRRALPFAGALLFTLGLAVSSVAQASGLGSIALSSFYQPESVAAAPEQGPWILPLDWAKVLNAAQVRTTLRR